HTPPLPAFPTRRSSDLSPHHCTFPADPEKLGKRVTVCRVGDLPIALREFEAARDPSLPSLHDFAKRGTVVARQCLYFLAEVADEDRKSTRLNSSHVAIS